MAEITDELTPALRTLMRSLSPQGRTRLLRTVARKMRKSNAERIKKNVEPDGGRMEPRKRGRERMFRRLHRVRYLKARVTGSESSVGWRGRVGRIAATHHFNLVVEAKGRRYRMPRRELLGISRKDEYLILDAIESELLSD